MKELPLFIPPSNLPLPNLPSSYLFVLSSDGTILSHNVSSSDTFFSPLVLPSTNSSFTEFLSSLCPQWKDLLPSSILISSPLFLKFNHPIQSILGISLHSLLIPSNSSPPSPLSPYLSLSLTLIPQSYSFHSPHPPSSNTFDFHKFTHFLPTIFYQQSPDLSFSYSSPSIQRILSLSQKELYLNKNLFFNQLSPSDFSLLSSSLSQHSSSPHPYSLYYKFHHPLNHSILFLLDIRSNKFSPNGTLIGYEGVLMDITKQSLAENELLKTTWKKNLSTITSGLVHDFNNNIANIQAISDSLLSLLSLLPSSSDSSLSHNLNLIRSSTTDTHKILRRILQLNNDPSPQNELLNLNSLIEDQLDLLKIILPKKSSILTSLHPSELPIFTDSFAFRQAIINLALNSKDASKNTLSLSLLTQKIPKHSLIFSNCFHGPIPAPHDGALFSFSDNGPGIPKNLFPKIFLPFFTTKNTDKGSGLGLYNLKIFAENSNALIDFSSSPHSGTSFFLFFPLAHSSHPSLT